LYVSTANYQTLKSTNGGYDWSPIEIDLPGNRYAPVLAIDPQTPQILYAGDSQGVFKSMDGGSSWDSASTGLPNLPVRILVIDPRTPQILYTSITNLNNQHRLFKSINGGNNWNPADANLPDNAAVLALAIDPHTPQILYAGTGFMGPGATGGGAGIFKSVDGGESWNPVNAGLASPFVRVNAIVIDPQTPQTLYAGVGYRSGVPGQEDGGVGVYKSTDGGGNWNLVNTGLPNAPVTTLAIDAQNPQTLYAGTHDGYGSYGVYKSTDGGVSWFEINNGLSNPFVRLLAIPPLAPQFLYAGATGGSVFVLEPASIAPPYTVYVPVILKNE
jgi:photosystem II stability/assembly factor-like uncharacterized protein